MYVRNVSLSLSLVTNYSIKNWLKLRDDDLGRQRGKKYYEDQLTSVTVQEQNPFRDERQANEEHERSLCSQVLLALSYMTFAW